MKIGEVLTYGKLVLWSKTREQMRREHRLSYLFWECTLKCNFFCQHCGSSAGGNKALEKELSTDEIKKVFADVAAKYNPREIMLAITGGEPLLRQDLFEVMKYAHSLGFSWGMVTNGYLMTAEKARAAKKAGMATVVVSIDGLGDVHDKFRNKEGAYLRAINAIKLLATENFLDDLQITTTVHQKNFSQLEEMYQEFTKLPITSWRVMNVAPIGRGEGNKEALLEEDQIAKLIDFIATKRKKKGIKVTYGCEGYLGPKYEGKTREWLFNCNTGINTGSILYNGNIFVCPNVPRVPELIQGNVRHDNFADIWENKFEFFRDPDRTSCEKCRKCSDWDLCLGGSMHLWDFSKGEPKMCHKEIVENK